MALFGSFVPPTHLSLVAWHAHEMLFGFAAAVIAGFLLTAVSNWTSRETVTGLPLLLLSTLFVAGRVAVTFGAHLPRGIPLLVDGAFLPVLALLLARPIVAVRNAKNLIVVAIVVGLATANVMVHLAALGIAVEWAHRGVVVSVDLVTLVSSIIAGRVFPMFTRNATRRESVQGSPWLDAASLGALLALTVLDASGVERAFVGGIFVAASVLLVVRAWHWGARHTLRTPLLWILHLGYAWLCIGLFLRGLSMLGANVPASLGVHALTVGAIGSLTIGMIARVSLGHTGRPLEAPGAAVLAFVVIGLAGIVRVLAPLALPERTPTCWAIAGTLFAIAFMLLFAAYSRILLSPRVDGKRG
jgi:uncharacterized protein involved in response to NO